MSNESDIKVKTGFWFLEPLPFYLNVWLFKVNRLSGHGNYTSFQKTPSGVTLRIVDTGEWTIKMCGKERHASRGDIFCTMPSETVEFSQNKDCPWEWHELQFNGTAAEKFIGEFGLGKHNFMIRPHNPGKALRMFKRINDYFHDGKRSIPMLLSMLFQLIYICGKNETNTSSNRETSRNSIVARAIEYFESVPYFNINISEMSDILKVERSTLYRAFLAKTGKSPHQYIDWMKITRSEELLANSNLSIALVSKHMGFTDVKYFSYWFKNKKGLSPGAWRKQAKKPTRKKR